jgi:hypothetical protein
MVSTTYENVELSNLKRYGRWMAKLVAHMLGISLGSNPDIYQKYKIRDINKGVAIGQHTLVRQKNI